jgi:serine protease Do
MSGSPAEDAGFKRGDVIVSVDGNAVKSAQDVVLSIRNKMADDRVSIEIYRDGKKQSINVVLGDIPGKDEDSQQRRSSRGRDSRSASRQLTVIGATVSEINEAVEERYDLPSRDGVVVVSVERDSIANELGLLQGDQILEVNRRRINSISDLERSVGRNPQTIVMLVQRGGKTLFFSYKK